MDKLFFFTVVLNVYAAQQGPWLNASTTAHQTRGIHSRANDGQDREIAESFVLRSMVYHDSAFKAAPMNF